MPNLFRLILGLNDTRNVANGIGLIGDGTTNGNRMIHDDGIMHWVGTCHGISPHATDYGIVATRHGVSSPPDVSKIDNQFRKPVSGSVPMIIIQYKATVKHCSNKNGHEFFQWQSRFYDHIIRNEDPFQNIVNYMANNPRQWEDDKFYLK